MSASPRKPTDVVPLRRPSLSRTAHLKRIFHSWHTWPSRADLPPALRSPDSPAELSDFGVEMLAALAELAKLTAGDLPVARGFLEAATGEKDGCSGVEVVRWACVLAGGKGDTRGDDGPVAPVAVEQTAADARTGGDSSFGRGCWRGYLCAAWFVAMVVCVFCLALLVLDERTRRRQRQLGRGGAGGAWFDHLGLP